MKNEVSPYKINDKVTCNHTKDVGTVIEILPRKNIDNVVYSFDYRVKFIRWIAFWYTLTMTDIELRPALKR